MSRKGFRYKLRGWIKGCLWHISVSSKDKEFRCLLLFFFFFTLVMDTLSPILTEGETIILEYHLHFYDSLLFSEGADKYLLNVESLVSCFELVVVLGINWFKRFTLCSVYSTEECRDLPALFGCSLLIGLLITWGSFGLFPPNLFGPWCWVDVKRTPWFGWLTILYFEDSITLIKAASLSNMPIYYLSVFRIFKA